MVVNSSSVNQDVFIHRHTGEETDMGLNCWNKELAVQEDTAEMEEYEMP